MDQARTSLIDRVRRFVDEHLADRSHTESFETLACDIHRWQRAHAHTIEANSYTPFEDWTEIPCIPVDVYKSLRIGTVSPDEPSVVFRTSGTTQGRRGEHHIRDTGLYDHTAPRWAARCVPDTPTRVIALLHDPAVAPDSSLSHMVAAFGEVSWHLVDGQLDLASLDRALQHLDGPVYVCATAFALADWLDTEPAPLPPGSVLMVTGGFKGRRIALSDSEMYALAQRCLAPVRLVTEYGMTELSSQLWGLPGAAYVPPPWLRPIIVDVYGRPVPTGTSGQIRFLDLLNVDSSIGIETADQGHLDDHGHLWLEGRLPGALVRGCSLTVEDAKPRPAVVQRPATPGATIAEDRSADVLKWVDALLRDGANMPDVGLSERGAHLVLERAIHAIDHTLYALLDHPRPAPADAVFVAARTVATAPIEWLALLMTRGTSVTLKHPATAPGLAPWLAKHAATYDLPLSITADRQIVRDASLVIVMGSDETVDEVRAMARGTVRGFGHRFSAAWCAEGSPSRSAGELIMTLAAHDGRGCMTPAVILASGDPDVTRQVLLQTSGRLARRVPIGEVAPAEVAAIRARSALARCVGAVYGRNGVYLHVLPPEHASPVALPRCAQLVMVEDEDEARAWLEPHLGSLSTLGVHDGISPWDDLPDHVRVSSFKEMQAPPLRRKHDGIDTFDAVSL